MKQFLLVGFFTLLSLASMQAETSNKKEVIENSEPVSELFIELKTNSFKVSAKKKDILIEKIQLKLNGKINLFVLKERRVFC
ncbi:hypothetical protein BZARG_2433 [Bizionia argentinensis JUB59]|uniref:Auto-transporter adhesin head GIN domain-containing protein n=1 Tax=Bizionia argentinensis JUB59 TaxID=1046627 RepID=G2EF60_9FLAO|nr:hypothetical protein [Bizionia argentinensis]EGV42945.1 hypothetical protein BZARG_2433 [Bizionia argentinensis JUB59]